MAILTNTHTTVDSSASLQNFTIETNAAMFKMLTTNIYNNIQLAAIREWSTNAIDACISADIPINYDVHLPTASEPYLAVRDYGTGLPESDITGLFAVLGASTKRDSNKFNGQWGVGRMAGLAYADSFTVTSYHNGTQYTYLITISEGIPASAKLGEQPTTEPNGLQLSLQVEHKDIGDFQSKAQKLYRFFEHKPNLNIDLDLELDKTVTGTNWYITPNTNHFTLVMGNVPYKVDDYEFDHVIRNYIFSGLVVDVPLGSVTITPGRESLTMDDTTIEFISSRVLEVKEEIIAQAQASLDPTLTFIPKAVAASIIHDALPYQVKSDFKYTLSTTEAQHLTTQRGYTYFRDGTNSPTLELKMMSSYYKSMKDISSNIHINTKLKFMLADTPNKYKDSVIQYRDSLQGGHTIILVRPVKPNKSTHAAFITEAEQYLSTLCITDYARTSDYYEETVKSSVPKKPSGFYPLIPSTSLHEPNTYVRLTKHYHMIDKFTEHTKLYFPTSGFDPIMDGAELNKLCRLHSFMTSTIPADDFGKTIIVGIPKKYIKLVENDDSFIPIQKALTDASKHFNLTYPDFTEYLTTNDQLQRGVTDTLLKLKEVLPSEVIQFLETLSTFKKSHTLVNYHIADLLTEYNITHTKPAITTTLADITIKYPLLVHLINEANRYSSIEAEHITHYLDLIERANNANTNSTL